MNELRAIVYIPLIFTWLILMGFTGMILIALVRCIWKEIMRKFNN